MVITSRGKTRILDDHRVLLQEIERLELQEEEASFLNVLPDFSIFLSSFYYRS